jgi:hypothetical protein
MTSLLEFHARAELCRRFARLEPQTASVWLAEAESWSSLTRQPCRCIVTDEPIPSGILKAQHFQPFR